MAVSFKYDELASARNIRLLRFLPSPAPGDVSCEISTWELEAVPPYAAVLYTWGSSQDAQSIIVNGTPVTVRQNCKDVLLQAQAYLSGENAEIQDVHHVWIDAICIDQSNLGEKSKLVQHMGDVYVKAALVLASLGIQDADTPLVFGLLQWHRATGKDTSELITCTNLERIIRDYHDSIGDAFGNPGSSIELSEDAIHQTAEEFTRSFARLKYHIYWTRRWVVQEIVPAKNVQVLWAWSSLPLEALMSDVPFAYSHCMRSILRLKYSKTNFGRPLPFNDVIVALQSHECENPLDYVYSILSLVEGGAFIQSDYEKPPLQLAMEIVKTFFRSSDYAASEYWNHDNPVHILLQKFNIEPENLKARPEFIVHFGTWHLLDQSLVTFESGQRSGYVRWHDTQGAGLLVVSSSRYEGAQQTINIEEANMLPFDLKVSDICGEARPNDLLYRPCLKMRSWLILRRIPGNEAEHFYTVSGLVDFDLKGKKDEALGFYKRQQHLNITLFFKPEDFLVFALVNKRDQVSADSLTFQAIGVIPVQDAAELSLSELTAIQPLERSKYQLTLDSMASSVRYSHEVSGPRWTSGGWASRSHIMAFQAEIQALLESRKPGVEVQGEDATESYPRNKCSWTYINKLLELQENDSGALTIDETACDFNRLIQSSDSPESFPSGPGIRPLFSRQGRIIGSICSAAQAGDFLFELSGPRYSHTRYDAFLVVRKEYVLYSIVGFASCIFTVPTLSGENIHKQQLLVDPEDALVFHLVAPGLCRGEQEALVTRATRPALSSYITLGELKPELETGWGQAENPVWGER